MPHPIQLWPIRRKNAQANNHTNGILMANKLPPVFVVTKSIGISPLCPYITL